ncbi:hypothetical protein [uncultured Sphingomonas sp.]
MDDGSNKARPAPPSQCQKRSSIIDAVTAATTSANVSPPLTGCSMTQ